MFLVEALRHTALTVNEEIDRDTDSHIQGYINSNHAAIMKRVRVLDQDWDIKRVLEVNASTLALSGLILGVTVIKNWRALPAVVLTFLFQHGIQG